MGRKPKAGSGAASKDGSLPVLQQRLLLNRWMCQQLGGEDFKALRERLRDQREAWSEDGHSYFFYALRGTSGLKIAEDKLAEYDLHIKAHLDRMNRVRRPTVQLKYFQYLALLFTEMYLDQLFNHRERLLADLNEFCRNTGWDIPTEFTGSDLTKLAFWMATGSGKTLLMHINLWQYLHYSAGKVRHENILLITPNEGLSRQHLEEFHKSGINAQPYSVWSSAQQELQGDDPLVKVIEITKLTEKKKGDGQSVELDSFGSNNLLFVDEGHRGASGDVWRRARAKLAERGFTFEYSATFGQIVNGASASKRPDLLKEYAKSILFDYSYPHFYADGYGKDYFILNLKDETKTFNNLIMLGNLLSFYEQCLIYDSHTEALRPYNLEKPLWVFVGHSVTGGSKKEDNESLTDVQEIVRFFADFLRDKATWKQRIEQLLCGQSELKDSDHEDTFKNLFCYLKEQGLTAEAIYDGIVQRVFHAKAGETLRAVELKNAASEIGLRAGDSYFGVINIGDVRGLITRLKRQQIVCEEENISGSLFDRINSADSPVNLLIGSRKFMEGWDSFRVASMGLMNIGKGEGAQIIQLFGRGVRLWGKERSLKRSRVIDHDGAPPYIELLETLNVFGIRANYMGQFREYLKQEGITEFEEVIIPVRVQEDFLQRGLQVLRLPDGISFVEQKGLVLHPDQTIRITLDLRPKLELAQSDKQDERMGSTAGEDKSQQLRQLIPLLNWERIYFELLEFRRVKGLYNLSFTTETLRQILENGNYTVQGSDDQLLPRRFTDLRRAEEIAVSVLKKYAAAFYDHERKAWERENLHLAPLTSNDPNLKWNERQGAPYYTLKIARERKEFLTKVRKLVEQAEKLYQQDVKEFPNIHFERHLYLPLLSAHENIDTITPPGLNEGEAKFVRDLRDYLQEHQKQFQGKEVFLLRNLTRGKGIGFFDAKYGETPYPDFILWVLEDSTQWIVFIEPHGLRMTQDGFNDPKIRLHTELEQLCDELSKNCPAKACQRVKLTSFVVSTSKYDEISRLFGVSSKDEFLKHQVVFQEDTNYIAEMFRRLEIVSDTQSRDGGQPMTGYTIGVDVGTASARAGLFDLTGKRLALATEPIQIHRPLPEYAEQSSENIWRAVCTVVRAVVSEARIQPDMVLGIGYDATCSLVALDANDQPISISPTGDPQWNIIMWMDHRAIAETDQANAGGYEALRYSGGALSPEMEPPKLAWLRRHMPETFERAGKFLDLADFLVYRSTGNNLRSECTMGCKWTYLPAEKRWDMRLLQDLGIESILERGRAGEAILPLGSSAGTLTPQAASELGLSTRTQVAIGIVDAHAGTIGLLGAVWAGDPAPSLEKLERATALIAGTSSCLMALSREPRFVQGVWGPYYGAVLPNMWMNEGGQSAAGALIDYTLEHHRQYPALELKAEHEGVSVYEAANRIVDQLAQGLPYPALLTRHLHVLPDHYGNRAPYADPHARGVVDGLTLDASLNALATLYYATLQALAYNIRDVLRAMAEAGYLTEAIYVTGGSVKNRLWLRETADITGCRVVVNREPEAVLLGSAILGATAAGAYPDIPSAMHAMTAHELVVEPNPATAEYHAAKFALFRELYQQHRARREAMRRFEP